MSEIKRGILRLIEDEINAHKRERDYHAKISKKFNANQSALLQMQINLLDKLYKKINNRTR